MTKRKRGSDLEGESEDVRPRGTRSQTEAVPLPSPVDLGVLRDASDGDPIFERRLIELFLRDLDRHLTSLEGAAERDDRHALLRTAHSIKGAGAQVGANGLHTLANELEDAIQADPSGPLTDELQRLTSEAARVRVALTARLGEDASE